MSYASLTDIHQYLSPSGDSSPLDTSQDVELQLALDAATSAIDRASNRQFAAQDSSATTRYFTADRMSGLQPFLMPSTMFNYWFPFQSGFVFPDGCVPVDDIFLVNQTINNIAVTDHSTGASLAIDRLWPFNAAAKGRPYTAIYFAPSVPLPRGEGGIDVNAKFGWVTVPNTIKNACLLQAARYMKRKDSPLGIAGATNMGNDMRLLSQLDPDVAMMIADYRDWWGAAPGGPYSNGAVY